jgi:hypothetical protein
VVGPATPGMGMPPYPPGSRPPGRPGPGRRWGGGGGDVIPGEVVDDD